MSPTDNIQAEIEPGQQSGDEVKEAVVACDAFVSSLRDFQARDPPSYQNV